MKVTKNTNYILSSSVFFAFPIAILGKMLKTQSRVASIVFRKGEMSGQGIWEM